MNTKNESRRKTLVGEHEEREPLPQDERMVGFNALSDPSGGFIGFPIFSDVQDEKLRDELMEHGLDRRDAEHITQAVCNNCDVFLTRDVKSIIGAAWQVAGREVGPTEGAATVTACVRVAFR
jgi:hypothetical protein